MDQPFTVQPSASLTSLFRFQQLWWILLKERNSLAVERHAARARRSPLTTLCFSPARLYLLHSPKSTTLIRTLSVSVKAH